VIFISRWTIAQEDARRLNGSIFAAIKRLSEESQPIVASVKRPAVVFVTCQPSKNTSSSSLREFLSLLTWRALRASYRNSSANFNIAEHCPANAIRAIWRILRDCLALAMLRNADGKLARTETRETRITLFPFAPGNLDPDLGKLN